MKAEFVFIDDQNKAQLMIKLGTWLAEDFIKRGEPGNHFFHNINLIEAAFKRCDAMLALNEADEIVAYMTWGKYDSGAEIVIVEVREDCRQQGLFRNMLSAFSNKFTALSVLTASVLPQSQNVFARLGWELIGSSKLFFKMLKPVIPSYKELPHGLCVAVFSSSDLPALHEKTDFYKVQAKPTKYQIQYYELSLDTSGKLINSIVTKFDHEGYIGLYVNKKLISEGKAKHLFESNKCHGKLLIIGRLDLKDPELLEKILLYSQDEHKTTGSESSSKLPEKAERLKSKATLFQPQDSISDNAEQQSRADPLELL